MDKDFYNEASASKLGWDPSWFDCINFDERLVDAVKKFQKKHGLKADGMCGPSTFRRKALEIRSKNLKHKSVKIPNKQKHIICNGNEVEIKWDKVLLWSDYDGLKLNKGFRVNSNRKPTMFVNHWDVCLNSESCVRVLNKRGISVHFCVDNDGTIYQLLDTSNIAWHAGGKSWNNSSIGVEISNAYYPKYQNWYKKNGFGERPVWKNKKVHGKTQPDFLGFYDVQIEALKALWQAVSVAHGIPLVGPKVKDGIDPDSVNCKFSGFINHFNLKKNKIDCAGLDIEEILKTI
jgi:peptidoglycan hydrolase-like protein with peptidoglycan-binding domain